MNIFIEILKFLDFQMKKPSDYGWFHILSLFVMVLVIILLYLKKPNVKKFLLFCSVIMLIFELYKQLNFSFCNDNYMFKYQWYAFPYQFCSTPMYVALIAALTKNKKMENYLFSFLVTYGLTAGISVMLYPNTVFITSSLINIQTMVHHGLMVIMGVYLIMTKSAVFNFKTILNAFKVFTVLILIALLINITTYYLGIDNGLEMFYISPFHTSSLPIFSIIYEKIPYILFLLFYMFVFTIGSSLILLLSKVFVNDKTNTLKMRKK